jgi:hypothetical protein
MNEKSVHDLFLYRKSQKLNTKKTIHAIPGDAPHVFGAAVTSLIASCPRGAMRLSKGNRVTH